MAPKVSVVLPVYNVGKYLRQCMDSIVGQTLEEIEIICYYGEKIEEKILSGEDRTEDEQKFHESIANATHNSFVKQFMPIIFNAIKKGVVVLTKDQDVSEDNLKDDRLIMDFIKKRNPEGARTAMRLHIIHAMERLQK